MARRWIRSKSRRAQSNTAGVAETALQGMGRKEWSAAHRKLMEPSKPKRIDPDSPEGRAIAEKYAPKRQQD